MTYAASQVAYWVGQANDASTGNHPTGWTSGQRWSETASEWYTMYNTEYGNARDNSAGQPNKPSGTAHPTGWVAGQLWSTTATQWNTMWGTEWTNARDNSGGQTSSGLGAAHPGGWGAGQLWSTTAEQWNAMWGTEWRAARDPQGYSYSYPGQSPNAVYWSQSASYWRGQADYYWGPNRVWNNGSTWEQLYNNYVGYYNDMVNQRNAWQANANTAYVGGTWGSGESWHQAYDRVLPAGSGSAHAYFLGTHGTGVNYADNVYQAAIGTQAINGTYFDNNGLRVRILRPGMYSVRGHIRSSYTFDYQIRRSIGWWVTRQNAGDGQAYASLPENGSDTAFMNIGDTIEVWYCSKVGSYGPYTTRLEITFVPTPSYPH